MKICNVFSYNLPSVGDRYCGVSQYFKIDGHITTDTPENIIDVVRRNHRVIFGGGGHFHLPSVDYNEGRFGHIEELLPYANKIILWGLGHNILNSKEISFPDYLDKFRLVGLRDYQVLEEVRKFGVGNWVACPSCMNKAFDKSYRIKEDIVVFSKSHLNIEGFEDYPCLEDSGKLTIKDCVSFLGQGRVVVTNSYHGAYWGLLLRRSVVVVDPNSSKFYGLTSKYEVEEGNLVFSPSKSYLKRCRESNIEFFNKLIGV